MYTDEQYHEARKRVAEKRKFYRHLSSYLTFAIFFFILNLLTSPGRWWFYWPLLGWGIGIVSHYFKAFGLPGEHAWEEREIEREMRRMNKNGLPSPQYRKGEDYEEMELKEIRREKQRSQNWRDEDLV